MSVAETAVERELLLVPVPAPSGPRVAPEVEPRPAGAPDPDVGVTGPGPGADGTDGVRARRRRRHTGGTAGRPDAAPRLHTAQVVLTGLAVLLIGVVAELALVSGLEHRSAQVSLFNQLRSELALGTAPLGPVGSDHRPVPIGAPIGLLTIPSIGVSQVVQQGTTSPVLADGPGHLRSTVFPGGAGTSVILGRTRAYGGPFARIAQLHKGARLTVVTMSGTAQFRVVDVHRAGARVLGPVPGTSRLELGTATGPAFAPSGVVWVDADKVGPPLASFRPLVRTVPADEQPLGTSSAHLWLLLLALEAMVAVLALTAWSWRRRGPATTWLVFTAPLLLLGVFFADQLAQLLPNLT
jgi:hypothetical protein